MILMILMIFVIACWREVSPRVSYSVGYADFTNLL